MTGQRRLALKRALGTASRLLPRPGRRRVILLYHSVGDSPWAVRPSAFRAQVEWLAANADIVPLRGLLANDSAAPLQAAITFDDGYASLCDAALPVLREHGAVASAFLNTGWIGTDKRRASDPAAGHYPQEWFLLWREVAALAAAGWEIGSHGVDHLDLTAQADDVVARELRDSRQHIEDEIGRCSPIFSYTWGRHAAILRKLVTEAGYTFAVAGRHRPLATGDNHFALPRLNIENCYTLGDFKAIVTGDWDYLGWIQSAKAAVRGVGRLIGEAGIRGECVR